MKSGFHPRKEESMFIEYTEECYGCKDYGTKECDKCFEKKCALTEIEAERKKKLEKKGK